jgi:uncharacterized protein YukE
VAKKDRPDEKPSDVDKALRKAAKREKAREARVKELADELEQQRRTLNTIGSGLHELRSVWNAGGKATVGRDEILLSIDQKLEDLKETLEGILNQITQMNERLVGRKRNE